MSPWTLQLKGGTHLDTATILSPNAAPSFPPLSTPPCAPQTRVEQGDGFGDWRKSCHFDGTATLLKPYYRRPRAYLELHNAVKNK